MRDFPRLPEIGAFNDAPLRRVAALPGIVAAAVASDHPLAAGFTNSFVVVGRESEARNWPEISIRSVSAEYARVAGLSLTAGRHLQPGDTAEAPAVLLINDTVRRLFFPTHDPGMAVGLVGALLLGSAIRVLLFGVGATDAATLTLSPLVIAISALVATYVSARRAARVALAVVLRPD